VSSSFEDLVADYRRLEARYREFLRSLSGMPTDFDPLRVERKKLKAKLAEASALVDKLRMLDAAQAAERDDTAEPDSQCSELSRNLRPRSG
jgi:hypothetical protein